MQSYFQGVYSTDTNNKISINGTTGEVRCNGSRLFAVTPANLRAEATKCATSAASAVALTSQDEARVRYTAFAPLAAPEAGGGSSPSVPARVSARRTRTRR